MCEGDENEKKQVERGAARRRRKYIYDVDGTHPRASSFVCADSRVDITVFVRAPLLLMLVRAFAKQRLIKSSVKLTKI